MFQKDNSKNSRKWRQAHKIDDFVTRLPNMTNSPNLGEISTKLEYEWEAWEGVYFFLHHLRKMNPEFGNTLICGILFSGTYVDRSAQSTTITNFILGGLVWDHYCVCVWSSWSRPRARARAAAPPAAAAWLRCTSRSLARNPTSSIPYKICRVCMTT